MKRAGVFIGVDNTGGLPQLNDAARSAKRMAEEWARKQGISPAKVLTDEGGKPVTAKKVKDAVNAILKAGNVEQLVVYFAGHGINKGYSEYWLLSDAPMDPQEAVNVRGSRDLAKDCGVPHVIFISDACRTAADSIGAQSVSGSEIFPNKQVTGKQKPVDIFYACEIGDPANEVRSAAKSARSYKAVYTAELLDALTFRHPAVAEKVVEGGRLVGYVRPFALGEHLETAVPRRIRDLGLQVTVIQKPNAEVMQRRPEGWLSRVVYPGGPPGTKRKKGGGGGARRVAPAARVVRRAKPLTTAGVSSALVQAALARPADLRQALVSARRSKAPVAGAMGRSAAEVAKPFGPSHQESECGFKIRGARIAEAVALGGRTEMSTRPADVVRVWDAKRKGSLVLLVLDNGNGMVLPAVPGFLAAITVDAGNVVDVSYEPSDNTRRWTGYRERADELRSLRAVVASATRHGAFRLAGKDALALARRMQYAKSVDPSLAVYAAYAYGDLGETARIRDMHRYMQRDLGAAFFDVAMLMQGRAAESRKAMAEANGFAPLLSQGWALLGSRRVRLPRGLEKLPGTLVSSVWTQFGPDGVAMLRRTLFRKEKR